MEGGTYSSTENKHFLCLKDGVGKVKEIKIKLCCHISAGEIDMERKVGIGGFGNCSQESDSHCGCDKW